MNGKTLLWISILTISAPLVCLAQGGSLANTTDQVPANWQGPVFEMSADYPDTEPPAESYPWLQFDFSTQPREYVTSVLAYVYEGNREVEWVLQDNAVRTWYHAPGLAAGSAGREFIHGMTRERRSRPGELHPNQTSSFENWAVGFYNPRGGFVVGKVWEDPNDPDPARGIFSEGTVAAKLLFTAATVNQVPYLEEAPVWQANTRRDLHEPNADPPTELRLLQLDVAVRDSRADDTTGWLFGTFVYQQDAAIADPWDRMVPVGLMWGNDPDLTPDLFAAGERPVESWINPDLDLPHLGWLDRLNGPVDNPDSSCLSCHATAGWPNVRLVFRNDDPVETKMQYFRNIKAGEPFRPQQQAVDYSLQVAFGIRNFPPSDEAVARPLAVAADFSPREGNTDLSPLDAVPFKADEAAAKATDTEDKEAPEPQPMTDDAPLDSAAAPQDEPGVSFGLIIGIVGLVIVVIVVVVIVAMRR